ncbi:hypothetical protein [Paludisphaera soli]|uniref:hypothetical protein n=1 Tax=Paludisphaera soli TaxID=2712865 RepID=UPI0013ED1527|nr:hypothetical protein [Paludisphaera soli]
MDGRKRRILGGACVGLATQLAAPGSCPGQAAPPPSSAPVRASASSPSPRRVDPDVERSHFHEGRPSPQQQAPAPPIPSKPQPSYGPPEAPPSYPNYAPPAPPPPQQPPQGYAPPYPGYAPPQYAPQQYMMVPVAPPTAAAPPANFFLPGAAPAAPAYGPPAAPAPMQPAYAMPMAPAYAMPMAPAPPPQPAAFGAGAALGGSSVSVPTSSSKTTVEIRGPGMLSAALARVGERMVQLGRTRVRTVQETVLQTPQSQPMGGTATIATAGLTPIQPQAAPPQPPQQSAPPQNAPPDSPAPSPQGTHGHSKSSAIHRLFGHE